MGGAGADDLDGGAGSDALSYATSGAGVAIDLKKGTATGGDATGDTIFDCENVIGSAFADKLTGDDDNNLLQGGGGDDTLDGGGNWDLLDGGAGNDTYVVDNVFDRLVDAAGTDTVTVKIATYTLEDGIENLTASGAMNFSLTGSASNNVIGGGAGSDRISGKLGNDVLTGGPGEDQFWFDTILNKKTNLDTIADFSPADDTIYLSRSIFKKIAHKGVLKKSAFKIGAKAGDADDRIVYDTNKGVLYYDSDGKGGAAAVQFAKFTKKTALGETDFLVVYPARQCVFDGGARTSGAGSSATSAVCGPSRPMLPGRLIKGSCPWREKASLPGAIPFR
jgi:serralysin